MSLKLACCTAIILTMLGLTTLVPLRAQPATQPVTSAAEQKPIEVAILTYGGGHGSKCFAPGFLDDAARKTELNITREFKEVALESPDLFKFPFVVLTGEGDFKLTDKEVEQLRAYLKKGGFVLASAGCASGEWAAAFETAMKRVLRKDYEKKVKPLALDHAIFHTIYDIDSLQTRHATDEKISIYGMETEGRITLLYSPFGLNDTANAGGNCCCCGGNEIQNARYINADALAYVLTR